MMADEARPSTSNAHDEMENQEMFNEERPHYINPDDSVNSGEVPGVPMIDVTGDNITFALIFYDGQGPMPKARMNTELAQYKVRYFRCPPGVTIKHLKKLLRFKYGLRRSLYRLEIFFKEDTLHDTYTLLEIAHTYLWGTDDDLILTFRAYLRPPPPRRPRPPEINLNEPLQSPKDNLQPQKLPGQEIPEEERPLRPDNEKKREEIELRAEEERRPSERERRSRDREKKKDHDKNKEKNKGKLDKAKEKKKEKVKKKVDEDKEGKKKDGKDKQAKKKDYEEIEVIEIDDRDKEENKKEGKDKEIKKKNYEEIETKKKDDEDKEGKKKDGKDKQAKNKDYEEIEVIEIDDGDKEEIKKDGKDKEIKKKNYEEIEIKKKDDGDKEGKKKDDKDKEGKKKDGKDKEEKKKDYEEMVLKKKNDKDKEEYKKDDKDKEGNKKDDKDKEEKKKHDEDKEAKKKDDKGGEAKKNETKEEKKKKKEKEGRCQEEKRNVREDKDDKDDKGMDKSDKIKDKDDKVQDKDERGKDKNDKLQDNDAKEGKNEVKEPKNEPDRKRKREGGEGDEKRKREMNEVHVDKGESEEPKENGCEIMGAEEQTTTAVPEPAPTSNSTQTLTGATSSNSPSAADSSQTSPPAAKHSTSNSATDSAEAPAPDAVQDSTTASESGSEPNSSTVTETEQKTEEITVEKEELQDSFEVAENNYTPPKEVEFKEVHIEISESGVWRISRVVEKPRDDVKTKDEGVDGGAAKPLPIPGTSSQSEDYGTGETWKKPFPKDEGFPKEPRGKVPLKRYKTIRQAPLVWHPYFSKEKLRSTFVRNPEESSRPAKFFKLRNKSRLQENPLSGVKEYSPARGEEEKMPQVATSDEIEQKKMEKEKRRFEEGSNPVTTSTNIGPTVEGDPNTFVSFDEKNPMGVVGGDETPDLSNNPKSDPTTSGPVDKEDKSSILDDNSVSELPIELKGDEKTFGSLDKGDKYSANADLMSNLQGVPTTLELNDKEGTLTMVHTSGCDLPNSLDMNTFEQSSSSIVAGSAPDHTMNMKMDLNTFGQYGTVEEKCPSIIVASAPNLMAGSFIPSSNHFVLSNLTYPSASGNYSVIAEPKLDESVLGNVMPGMSEVEVTGLEVGDGYGGPMSNGVTYSPVCYVDQYPLVYPYQTYPVTEATISHMPDLGKTGDFDQISGSQTMTLPPTANISSSPQQNSEGTSLAWANPINDGGNKCQEKKVAVEKAPVKKVAEMVPMKKVLVKKVPGEETYIVSLTPEDMERKRRRKEFENEVKRLLKPRPPTPPLPAKETKTKVVADPKCEQDEKEDVQAKRRRDEE